MIDSEALTRLETALADRPDRIVVGEGVDVAKIRDAARMAAVQIHEAGAAYVDLQPGDGIRYQITVAAPPVVHPWFVSLLNLGRGSTCHGWHPENSEWTSPEYALGKWTDSVWTSQVVAAFLNLLRDAWGEVTS